LGIEVLPPNVNNSGLDFTIEDKPEGVQGPAIRYGLGAIKNVGEGPVETILAARSTAGSFRDIDDFSDRVDLSKVNRRALESLIKAGAMAPFGSRTQLLAVIDRMMSISLQSRGTATQFTMFDMPAFANTARLAGDLPLVDEVSRKEILAWEKELIGAYISEHPLSRVWTDLEKAITVLTGQIDEAMAGQKVTVAGMVNLVRQINTKKGEAMAFAQIEDLQGTVEVVVFPRVWQATKDLWQPERILIVRGTVSLRGREPSIIADSATNEITTAHPADVSPGPQEATPYGSVPDAFTAQAHGTRRSEPIHLHITVSRGGSMEDVIRRLGQVYELLLRYPGEDRFSLYVDNGGQGRIQIDFPNNTTGHCLELEQSLRALVGAAAIRIEGGV
jgi:DNA polymerase-3 subunit alpha